MQSKSSITAWSVWLTTWGSDLSIVRSARVSYDAEWRAGADQGSDDRLINYLAKNQHTSPFESVTFTFEVNEVSARYSVLPEEFYVPEVAKITSQSKNNKQQRTDEVLPNAGAIARLINMACAEVFTDYKQLLAMGCPRELARAVLPVSTYSHMFATVNLHNLARFLKLHIHSHAQYEIRVYAEAMLELIKPIVPVAAKALVEHLEIET